MGTALDRVELRVLARSTAPDPAIAKPLDGELVAVVFDGLTPLVSASSEAFAAGLRNIANRQISSVDVMRVTEQCRLFIFQDDDPSLSARVLDPGALLRLISAGLPEAARASAQLGRNGVLAGVPRGDLLMVFVIDGGDLLAGATNLAANLATNYDPEVVGALSPWMYWVRDGRVEEMRYELDAAGEVEAINFPDPLLPLLPQN